MTTERSAVTIERPAVTAAAAIRLTIDGRAVEVPAGATVLDGVKRLGLPLPHLCKDPDRPPLGACRTCLVHVEGMRGVPAACHLPARDGMVVDTQHPDAVRIRTGVLDLTLSMLTPGEERNGFGQLSTDAARHGTLEPTLRAAAPLRGRRHQVVLRPRPRGVHPVRPLRGGLRRRAAHRRHRPARARSRHEGGRGRRRSHGVLGVHVVRPVRGDVPDGRAPSQGAAGQDHAHRGDDLPVLRGRLRHRAGRARGRAAGRHGRRRPGQSLQRGHAVREGALRHRLRARARPHHAPDGPARRALAGGLVGPRPGRRGGRARAPSRPLRGARVRQGHQRGRLRHPEVRARRHGHQQRGPLHAPLPLALGRSHAGVDGLGRDVELLRRLRRSGLPDARGGRRLRQPSRHRHPLPPRPAAAARASWW